MRSLNGNAALAGAAAAGHCWPPDEHTQPTLGNLVGDGIQSVRTHSLQAIMVALVEPSGSSSKA